MSPAGRQRATVLWKSLQLAEELVRHGERNGDIDPPADAEVIATAGDARIDYIALVDPQTLLPVCEIVGPTLAVMAVKIESTRLIDNCILEP